MRFTLPTAAPPGDLVIQKQVTGSGGDRSKEWTFHISVTPPSDVTSLTELKCVRDGKQETLLLDGDLYVYLLKSGESLTIKDLPTARSLP